MPDHASEVQCRRRDLEEAALQYARFKTLGRYLDGLGGWVMPSKTDVEIYTDIFQSQLRQAALNLLAELTAAPLPDPSAEAR